jgi:RNA polymerase sigma factor (sigma-70 family)
MSNQDRSPVTRYLLRMLGPTGAGGLSDAQLLERFVRQRDEAAFEVLVWRHGPKVLGVCRRVLRHDQDAEDAFQAVFLILARKGGSIGKGQAVASWLYQVAYRVALRARRRAEKRASQPLPPAEVPATPPAPNAEWSELRPVLDDEVNRLPEKYRAPFILCYVDGKTNEEAAQELACPKGTVQSRLAWARQRLRLRLTQRGVTLTGGLLGAALAPQLSAAVPASLAETTVKAGLLVAAGTAATGVVSGQVAALTQGVLRTMLWTKIMIVVGCTLLVAALGVGGAVLARPTPQDNSDVQAQPSTPATKADLPKPAATPKVAVQAQDPPDQSKVVEKTYEFQMSDHPWSKVLDWYAGISGLPYGGTYKPTGTVTFIPPKNKKYTLGQITDILNELLLTQKYILIRRTASFTVLPADERVDPTLLPRVELDDLAKRGKTELVTVVLPLTHLQAKDIGPDVRKMMGAFGQVVVLEKANQLILLDTAGNLQLVYQMIRTLETQEAAKKQVPPKQE